MQLRQFRDALYTYLIEASFARFIVDENYLDSLSTWEVRIIALGQQYTGCSLQTYQEAMTGADDATDYRDH